jgi:hypothetical protein
MKRKDMASDGQAGKYVSGCPIRNYGQTEQMFRNRYRILTMEKTRILPPNPDIGCDGWMRAEFADHRLC